MAFYFPFMQRLVYPILFCLVPLTLAHAQAGSVASPSFLRELVKEALASHPSMQAAQARAEASEAAIGAVRLWEDPKLALGVRAADEEMRRSDGDLFLGVDQMLPRRRLYAAEKRRAEATQAGRKADRNMTANDLGRSVTQAALELALADELIRVQQEDLTLMDTMVAAAQERAKNPDANAAEALRLESEQATRRQALASAGLQRRQLATNLNLLLGRPANQPWEPLSLPNQPPALPLSPELLAKVEQGNPTLSSRRTEIAGSEAETEMARLKRNASASLALGTNVYSGGDIRDGMLTVNVSLPWFNRSIYAADISRAERTQEASQQDLATEQRKLSSEATAMLTEAENNRQIVSTYANDILPKAEHALEAMRNAWISSKATLVEVLDTRRNVLMARQERQRALAASHVAAQNLAALTGAFSETLDP
jgi:cobalt-zinc-cadmium efflux system outer membrane protein